MEKIIELLSQVVIEFKKLNIDTPKSESQPVRWKIVGDSIGTTEEISGNVVCEAPKHWKDSMEHWEKNAKQIVLVPEMIKVLKLVYSETYHLHYLEPMREKIEDIFKRAGVTM
jgi:hypothetical protein